MHYLQIELDIDTTHDQVPEVKVTPVDVPIGDENAAHALAIAIGLADAGDPKPGDADYETPTTHLKIKVPVVFTTLNLTADAWAHVRLVEKEDPAPTEQPTLPV